MILHINTTNELLVESDYDKFSTFVTKTRVNNPLPLNGLDSHVLTRKGNKQVVV